MNTVAHGVLAQPDMAQASRKRRHWPRRSRLGLDVVRCGLSTSPDRGFVDSFGARAMNTHPALLPAFKGWHAVRDALAAGVKVTGCTVHLVTEEVDAGPILAQEAVPVLDDDTEETLHERIKQVERRLYPDAIERLVREQKS